MNTPSNVMSESFESQRVAPLALSATRPFYWSLRREIWENRLIYLAPLAVAGVFLFGFLISTIHLPAKIRGLTGLDAMHQRAVITLPYDIAGGLMMITAMLVGVLYCLDALYGERRDRSILFWKSLPVSDLTAVLAKATIPLVVLPLLAFATSIAMYVVILLVSSAVLAGSGLSVATLWTQLSLFQMSLLLLYHLVTVHALWPAPLYGWFLMVSAWAKRAPFLWAVLPLVAIAGLEAIVFRTSYFGHLLLNRLSGGGHEAIIAPDDFPTHPMTHLTPGRFLSAPGLWVGLLVTAAFLAAAVRLRRNRGPI